jgi:hypothetical protein
MDAEFAETASLFRIGTARDISRVEKVVGDQ